MINLITKSGTNQLHGDLYEFFRNNALDANDFFLNRAGRPVPPYRFNQFGGTLGGPVRIPSVYNGKDRTFFFVSYEGLRWIRSLNATGTMPTAAQRMGDFSHTFNSQGQLITIFNPFTTRPDPSNPGRFIRDPFEGNQIPTSMIDPVAANLLKWMPLPNAAGNPITGANNFVSSYASEVRKDTGSIRLDHALTENQKIFARFMMNNTPVTRPLLYGQQLAASSPTLGNDELNQRSAAIDYTNPMKPNFVMELNASFIRYSIQRRGPGNGFDPTQLGFPSYFHQLQPALVPCFPSIGITGLGVTVNIPDNGGGLIGNCGILHDAYQDQNNVANLTYILGAHTLKFGGNWGWRVLNTGRYGGAFAGFSFDPSMTQGPNPLVSSSSAGAGLASFLLGAGSGGSINSSGPGQNLLYHYYGVYLEDDWKAMPKLTLNLGIRYDYSSPWTERYNRFSNFNFSAVSPLQISGFRQLVGGLEFPGSNGLPRGQFNPDYDNLAPRFGIAYQIEKNTVIRGGFGLFYAPITGGGYNGAAVPISGFQASTPWVATLNGMNPINLLSNPFPNGFIFATGNTLGLATLLGQGVTGMDRHRPNPYAMDWNFSIEHSLPGSFVLDLAYAGSRGIDLYGNLNYDQLPDQYLSEGSTLNQLVPNPFYGKIAIGALSGPLVTASQLLRPYPQFTGVTAGNAAWGSSGYNALEISLERRFSHGFSMQLSYTWSKTMDNLGPTTTGFPGGEFYGGGIQDYYNRRDEWAPAVWDIPNNFVLNSIWQLPFGKGRRFLNGDGVAARILGDWQLGSILTLQNGVPLQLTTATNTLFNYSGVQFPNWNGTTPYVGGSVSKKLDSYFNTSAFAVPPPFTYGNVGRTLSWLRGPGFANLDASLDKTIPIKENLSMQIRFEAFNALNRPQFGEPNTSIGSPTAGVISDQQNFPRQLQFALKLLF